MLPVTLPSFNPRTRVGCDRLRSCRALCDKVSIHAPAWGATFWGCKKPRCIPWFQSTHPRGVRLRVLVRAYSIQPFQSTHPRGVRRIPCEVYPADWKFQSTHPRGVRPSTTGDDLELFGFQSTHPRGVRLLNQFLYFYIKIVSIHAPAWGATAGAGAGLQHPAVSIHAPAWGATW